jgi:hypothetical protein
MFHHGLKDVSKLNSDEITNTPRPLDARGDLQLTITNPQHQHHCITQPPQSDHPGRSDHITGSPQQPPAVSAFRATREEKAQEIT